MRIPSELCVRCKGYKRLCGLPKCPILERVRSNYKAVHTIKGRFVEGATPPSVIVGESRYPLVPVIYNVPPGVRGDEAKKFDDPINWWGKLSLEEVIRRRSYQIASVLRVGVNDFRKLYELEVSTASVSIKPVDSEAILKKPPKPKLSFKLGIDPVGPSAEAERIKVIGNSSMPKKLEKLVWDDLRADEAVRELYRSGVNRYITIRALSLGLLGRLRRRKLVPTRWAITAVDNILSKSFIKELTQLKEINDVEVYISEYLGNKFTVILYPGKYVSEWLEIWYPLTVFTSKALHPIVVYNEDIGLGKTITLDGGFDAAREALTEALWRRGRTASAIIIREVMPDYYASIGNWHIRETVYNALRNKPQRFNNLVEALKALESLVSKETYFYVKQRIRGLKQKSLIEYSSANE